ncbi:uncharacterized protein BJ212DRAFT_1487255 [Suillus subaureus]|uniref:Uncharacterized protein n=1 Tax=Suillus subaureus TaxID=48587 RepID=A0A9P7DU85_9AGAM|nr:uncharacterized protein BJ212DRAFT_1487255 [Suillus subaureus]KAG1803033.1 hypothetical protein BJ212DRAFT_1487255 [Suillus subaureus]
MDVDESTVSQASLDQSPPAQADHPGFLINPDLYLGPEDDIIDVDELLDSANPKIDVLAASEASMSLDDTSNELQSEQPELTNKDLCLMAWEF